jgi:hypothetical protein
MFIDEIKILFYLVQVKTDASKSIKMDIEIINYFIDVLYHIAIKPTFVYV